MTGHRPRERGSALIAVLWIGTLAGIILLGVQQASRVDLAAAHAELAQVQAHWLARAGVEQAIALLEDDSVATDSELDVWYENERAFEEVETDAGWFWVLAPTPDGDPPGEPRFGLVDLAGRLNVNVADEAALGALPDIEPRQVRSILDWRDQDQEIRNGSAEREHYLRLDFPYEIRNGPLQTLREILQVRGIEAVTFTGEDGDGDGVLDPGEDDGGVTAPLDDADGELDPGLGGLLTVYSYELDKDGYDGDRIKVNEVNEDTLKTRFNFSSPLARGFVARRDQKKFEKLMDMLEVKPANPEPGDEDDPDGAVNEITLQWIGNQMDRLTVSDQGWIAGRINLNTAPRQVLMTLPQMTAEAAEGITTYRRSPRGPFFRVGDLLSIAGMSDEIFKAVAESCTVRSYVFEVSAVGLARSGVRQRITAVVDRAADPISVLYWYQSE